MTEKPDTFECEDCGENLPDEEMSLNHDHVCWTCADMRDPDGDDE